MSRWEGSLVEQVTNPSRGIRTTKEVKALELHDGYTLEAFFNDYLKLVEHVNALESAHNELVSKYNSLLAAYKANTAKTAMELLDIKENN